MKHIFKFIVVALGMILVTILSKIVELFYRIKNWLSYKIYNWKFKRLQKDTIKKFLAFEHTLLKNWVAHTEKVGFKFAFDIEYHTMSKVINAYFETEKQRLISMDIFEHDAEKIKRLKPWINSDRFLKYYLKSKVEVIPTPTGFKDSVPDDMFVRKLK